MKSFAKLGLALALVLSLVAAATAGEEKTLSGKVVCAKCTLKKADASKCQDVLVVEGAEYYVEKNAVSEKFGHVCSNSKTAVVTGAVAEKDGKKWITPSKMDETKS